MAKNYIPEIAKMLGVEPGEEFEVEGMKGVKYRLTEEEGLMMTAGGAEYTSKLIAFVKLLCGEREIVRRPWRPKMGQKYWTVCIYKGEPAGVQSSTYLGGEVELGYILMGNCFPTIEAAEAAAPDVVKFYEDVRKMVEEE